MKYTYRDKKTYKLKHKLKLLLTILFAVLISITGYIISREAFADTSPYGTATVTFNAGTNGQFADGTTTNTVTYNLRKVTTKYSHSHNIEDNGKYRTGYGYNINTNTNNDAKILLEYTLYEGRERALEYVDIKNDIYMVSSLSSCSELAPYCRIVPNIPLHIIYNNPSLMFIRLILMSLTESIIVCVERASRSEGSSVVRKL